MIVFLTQTIIRHGFLTKKGRVFGGGLAQWLHKKMQTDEMTLLFELSPTVTPQQVQYEASVQDLTCTGRGECFHQLQPNDEYVRGSCVHQCALHPCAHPLCTRRLPRHILTHYDGYCDHCHGVLVAVSFAGNKVVFNALYKNQDYCQLCYHLQQPRHVCHGDETSSNVSEHGTSLSITASFVFDSPVFLSSPAPLHMSSRDVIKSPPSPLPGFMPVGLVHSFSNPTLATTPSDGVIAPLFGVTMKKSRHRRMSSEIECNA